MKKNSSDLKIPNVAVETRRNYIDPAVMMENFASEYHPEIQPGDGDAAWKFWMRKNRRKTSSKPMFT